MNIAVINLNIGFCDQTNSYTFNTRPGLKFGLLQADHI